MIVIDSPQNIFRLALKTVPASLQNGRDYKITDLSKLSIISCCINIGDNKQKLRKKAEPFLALP
jgi:hypothetical protein